MITSKVYCANRSVRVRCPHPDHVGDRFRFVDEVTPPSPRGAVCRRCDPHASDPGPIPGELLAVDRPAA